MKSKIWFRVFDVVEIFRELRIEKYLIGLVIRRLLVGVFLGLGYKVEIVNVKGC